MQTLNDAHNVEEYDNGLFLCQLFLLDDVMLKVDQTCVLTTKVVWYQAVENETQPLFESTSQLHLTTVTEAFFLGFVLGAISKVNVV